MSSGFQSSGSSDLPPRETEPAADRSADSTSKSVHQELLDQVLRATLSLGGDDDLLGSDELRPLIAVAKRRGGEPLSIETVTELVQAALRLRFATLADSRTQWERMTRQIAETMINDPQTLIRIQSLWKLLCESAA